MSKWSSSINSVNRISIKRISIIEVVGSASGAVVLTALIVFLSSVLV
ncbi:DUF3948 family protein [Bacillus thuringiensis]